MTRLNGTSSDSALAAKIQALFSPTVSVAVTDPTEDHAPHFDAEFAVVADATPKRQREFLAGRAAARHAMGQMGVPKAPVLSDQDRAPVWPGSLTGSISHNDTLCVAVLTDARTVPAIGIDIEEKLPLAPELIPEICTLPERAWLACQPERERGVLAKLLFSAKECAYKCQFTLTRTFLEFSDLEITTDLETGQFEATFIRPVPGFAKGAQLFGRYVIDDRTIVTAITAQWQLAIPAMERRLHVS